MVKKLPPELAQFIKHATAGLYFKLDGHVPVPCDMEEAAKWIGFHVADQTFGNERIGLVQVSTVFLPIDHSWRPNTPPILFETLVFGGRHNEYQTRCATWEEALEMHAVAVALVRSEFSDLLHDIGGA